MKLDKYEAQGPFSKRSVILPLVLVAAGGISALTVDRISRLLKTDENPPVQKSTDLKDNSPEKKAGQYIVNLDEIDSFEDVMNVLRNGGIIEIDQKYIRIHRQTNGSFSLVCGYCSFRKNRLQTGQYYEFADTEMQKLFQEEMEGAKPSAITIGYGSQMALMETLKVEHPTKSSSRSLVITIDNPLLEIVGRNKFIVPIRRLGRDLNKLANFHVSTQKPEKIQFAGFTSDGKIHGKTLTFRYIGTYDPETGKEERGKEIK